MKIKKNIFAFLLSLVMLFSIVMPASALVIGDTADIAGVYGNRAIVIGKAEDYANKFITVLLLGGDGTDTSDTNILFMDTIKADDSGYYEIKIEYDGFSASEGVVNNCTLLVKAEGKDITDTVLSAKVKKTDMLAVELKTSLLETSAQAVAKINNLYGQSLDSVMMIAAYDDNNKLIGVAKADKVISEETDEISVTYENMPEKFSRLVAFVWDSASSLIPYTEQKDVDYADNDIRALVMHPGSDETMRRFVWYNDNLTYGAKIQYALKSDYEADGGFTDTNSIEVSGTTEVPPDNPTSISCKVDISDLVLDTEYVYRVGNTYKYDDTVYSFKTYDPDNSDKQVFIMTSDLHTNAYDVSSVGESPYVSQYQNYFNNYLLPRHPDVQFIASTGDNVSQANMPTQFEQYMNSDWEIYRQKAELEMEILFKPDVFKSVPWASTLGNHEANNSGQKYGSVTRWHYNLPNDDGITGTYYSSALDAPNTNGNFWFRNGDVLVIGINAVQYTSSVFAYSQPEHNAAYIKSAIEANEDAKWRILINHVPPYSFIGGFTEPPLLRQRFADMDIDQYDFDAVFTGHQHSYSRSKQLLTDDDSDYETLTYDGATRNFIKPTVVSEDDIVRDVDSNGKSYDIATNPEGAVHINLPSLQWAPYVDRVHPDYADFLEVIVTRTGSCYVNNAPATTFTSADVSTEWHNLDSKSSYVAVTVEKIDNGQQMKFEYIDNLTGDVIDTYIIKKTSAE